MPRSPPVTPRIGAGVSSCCIAAFERFVDEYRRCMQEDATGKDQGDRWARSDWWGVVLDAPDVGVLVRFYSELRGWPIWSQDDEGAALDLGEGVAYLSIQYNPDYVRPVWPAAPGSQQMMLHLDFQVTDLDTATSDALELGAQLPEHQPQDNVRVLLDPAGHPFCLYTD